MSATSARHNFPTSWMNFVINQYHSLDFHQKSSGQPPISKKCTPTVISFDKYYSLIGHILSAVEKTFRKQYPLSNFTKNVQNVLPVRNLTTILVLLVVTNNYIMNWLKICPWDMVSNSKSKKSMLSSLILSVI